MRVVAISDTHCLHRQLVIPDGDLLIHAGDWSNYGDAKDTRVFLRWIASQPHRHRIAVPGNHDIAVRQQMQAFRSEFKAAGVHLLIDEAVEIEGVKVYGHPWTPRFGRWAFMLDRPEMAGKLAHIPADVDILVSHGPPHQHLDWVPHRQTNAGCVELLNHCLIAQPKLLICGHIHEGAVQNQGRSQIGLTLVYNVSQPLTMMPVVIDI